MNVSVGVQSRGRRVIAALVVALALLSVVVDAQERPVTDRSLHWQPYAFMFAGQTADIWITNRNIARGCSEANAGVFGAMPSTWELVKGKAPAILVAAGLTAILQKTGHWKAAKWTGGSAGAIGFSAAAYNLTVQCGS